MDHDKVFVGLGIKFSTGDLVIAHLGHGRRSVEQVTKRRVKRHGCSKHRTFEVSDGMGDEVFQWLTGHGIPTDVATRLVQDVGKAMLDCVDPEVRESLEWQTK
jgi:hypothetical protein